MEVVILFSQEQREMQRWLIRVVLLRMLQTMFQANLQSVSNLMTSVLLWLTIFGTAILLPNTLATIFGIPYLPIDPSGNSWIWIAALLVLSSVLGTWIVYYYV